jgi:hypothetical protein
MIIHLNVPPPRRVVPWLLAIVGFLVVASLGTQIARYVLGHEYLLGFVYFFDVDQEANLPTWFSAIDLLLASAILSGIAVAKRRQNDRFALHWTVLALVFFGLSIDEAAVIHEISIDPLRDTFQLDGALHYAWVIPGAIFAVAFGAFMLRFLLSLPPGTRDAFIGAGALYVGGTIGVEMVSALWASAHGEANLTYNAIVTVEESFEMLGVVAFVGALLEYATTELAATTVRLGDAPLPDGDGPAPIVSGQVIRVDRALLKRFGRR